MLDRAAALSFQARRVHGGTFHSTASSILRRHGHNYGFDSDFSIIDQSDAEGIISLITSSLRLYGASNRFPNSRTVFSFFSAAVNENCSIDDVIQQDKQHLIIDHYSVYKIKHNLMNYDDLLINLFRLLSESSKDRLDIFRYWHVLVDEYQDTNWLQSMHCQNACQ